MSHATAAPKGVSRRAVVKGAAWSVPVLAATVATPLTSASAVAACPACFRPAVFAGGTWTSPNNPVAGNKGGVAITGSAPGRSPFGFDTSACANLGFQPSFSYTIDSAELTMVRANGAPDTYVVAGQGVPAMPAPPYVATLGSSVEFPTPPGSSVAFNWPNVAYPSGAYSATPPPVRPSALKVQITTILTPLGGGQPITCTSTLSWVLSNGPASGTVVFGTGQISFAGSAAPA